MNIIHVSRILILITALVIIGATGAGMIMRKSLRRQLIIWMLYGLSDFFIMIVLYFGFDYDILSWLYSLILFKNSIVATALLIQAERDVELKSWSWGRWPWRGK